MHVRMTFASTLNLLLFFCTTVCHAIVFENYAEPWVTIRIGSPENHDLMLFILEERDTLNQEYLPPITVLKVKRGDHTTQYQFAREDAPKGILKIVNHNDRAEIPLLEKYKVSAKAPSQTERKRSASQERKEKEKA